MRIIFGLGLAVLGVLLSSYGWYALTRGRWLRCLALQAAVVAMTFGGLWTLRDHWTLPDRAVRSDGRPLLRREDFTWHSSPSVFVSCRICGKSLGQWSTSHPEQIDDRCEECKRMEAFAKLLQPKD